MTVIQLRLFTHPLKQVYVPTVIADLCTTTNRFGISFSTDVPTLKGAVAAPGGATLSLGCYSFVQKSSVSVSNTKLIIIGVHPLKTQSIK